MFDITHYTCNNLQIKLFLIMFSDNNSWRDHSVCSAGLSKTGYCGWHILDNPVHRGVWHKKWHVRIGRWTALGLIYGIKWRRYYILLSNCESTFNFQCIYKIIYWIISLVLQLHWIMNRLSISGGNEINKRLLIIIVQIFFCVQEIKLKK